MRLKKRITRGSSSTKSAALLVFVPRQQHSTLHLSLSNLIPRVIQVVHFLKFGADVVFEPTLGMCVKHVQCAPQNIHEEFTLANDSPMHFHFCLKLSLLQWLSVRLMVWRVYMWQQPLTRQYNIDLQIFRFWTGYVWLYTIHRGALKQVAVSVICQKLEKKALNELYSKTKINGQIEV